MECKREIKKGAKYLDLKGIFTHLCVADTPSQDEVTRKQIQEFRKVCVSMNEVGLQEIHCLNSVEGLWYPPSVGDFSRLEIILYGLKPDYSNEIPKEIIPALEWKIVIFMIKTIPKEKIMDYG
ncbi:alanine racemase [Enterococcus faecium]|uniref:alanine racemase n=1 Tax=Enterococcus faecium TaxID=1352 RepID=UPI00112429CF|nr:alanine racemase [Enterococcus faecium]QDB89944.1 hypothetical protein FHK65_04225 [Enterococcus faecium]